MKYILLSISLGLWALTATLLFDSNPAEGAGDCATRSDLMMSMPTMPTRISMTCSENKTFGTLSCEGSLK